MRPVTIYIYLCGGGRTAAGWTGQGFGKWNFSAARFNGNCRRKRRDKAFLIDTIELLVSRRGLSYFSVSVIVNGKLLDQREVEWSKGIIGSSWWGCRVNVDSLEWSSIYYLLSFLSRIMFILFLFKKYTIFLSTFTFLIIDEFSKGWVWLISFEMY